MTLEGFLSQLEREPETIEFDDTLRIIDDHYAYTPVAFRNGPLANLPGQNVGSCKILAFAEMNQLSEARTLHCFGRFYRDEVMNDPQGEGHRNIRQFMRTGWAGIEFEARPLVQKPRD